MADYFTPFGGWQHTWKNATSAPLQTTYRYTGQRHEPDIKLYDYGARWYDNRRGRFIQPDTIVPDPGDPQSLNRYSYAANNPVRYTDPSGLFEEDEIEQYLRAKYGDRWRRYWNAWRGDKVFWAMLLLADYGDTLFAPTTSLTSGVFIHAGTTFSLKGEHELYEYQGYGPYRLVNNAGEKLAADQNITAHPVDLDSPRSKVWEQPLYRYTEAGPQYSGYWRSVSYQQTGWHIELLAGDSVPGIIGILGGLAQTAGKKFGVSLACPLCGGVLTVVSVATWANNATVLEYSLVVDYKDKRTWIGSADQCYPPLLDETEDLRK